MKKTTKKSTKQCCKKNELLAWDLSDLYNGIDDKQIEIDLDVYKNTAISFAKKYKGKLEKLTAKQFFEMAKLCEERSVLGNKIGVFAYLNMVTQMKNAKAMGFYQNISEKLNDYGLPMIFLSLEINKLPQTKIDEWLEDKKAAYYAPWLNRIRMFKNYELSEPVEEILHEKSVTSGDGWQRLYEETSARLKFVVDGKEYNDSEISKLTLDKDAKVRAKAGKEIARVFSENAPLFTLIYNMVVKDKAIEDINTKNVGSVPMHLRNSPVEGMKELGYKVGYLYPHDFPNHIVKQQYMPDELIGTRYYEPTDIGYEKKISDYVEFVRRINELN